MVVGCEKPSRSSCVSAASRGSKQLESVVSTLGNLLATVYLGDFLLQKLVALLADGVNLLTRDDELRHLGKDLLGDLSGRLVLGKSVRVVERVIYDCILDLS